MIKESGIENLSEIVDMGLIPGLKKASTPNKVLARLKQFLIENKELFKKEGVANALRDGLLSDEEKEVLISIRKTGGFNGVNAVDKIMCKHANCTLNEMAIMSSLCDIIKKLDNLINSRQKNSRIEDDLMGLENLDAENIISSEKYVHCEKCDIWYSRKYKEKAEQCRAERIEKELYGSAILIKDCPLCAMKNLGMMPMSIVSPEESLQHKRLSGSRTRLKSEKGDKTFLTLEEKK